LYIDNAKIYRSPQLARIAASIGTLVIHSRPYQPEGRGKIERCFRTAREQFLANLDPKRLLSLEELNERLWAWIDNVYHRCEHSALGTTPLLRWQRDIEQIRQLPPATDLRRLFFHRHDRLVRRDSTIWFQGQLQTTALPVDPIVNGQLPSAKRTEAVKPEPTGINFVELLPRQNDHGKGG